ncbi:MAG: contact-dependent growth inhibition system immunity protein [Gammaproteobacteria bacterium]|nr:contact-dependent growth inhibition system immunity protein [Gammaproteobacteria bacterium]MDH5799678.1 contact-dependent growth inhibition system immunity protein [Gammaproteobacteria bacterium]
MNSYQNLDNLIFSYFNQDFDLGGDSIEEIVKGFNSSHTEEQRNQVRQEIQAFMAGDNVESVFEEKYGFDVDPALWGHTAKSFLEKLLALI